MRTRNRSTDTRWSKVALLTFTAAVILAYAYGTNA